MTSAQMAAMRLHFPLFLMRVFGDLHPGAPPLALGWYLKAICFAAVNAAAQPGSRLVINMPPRHLKSVALSVAFTAWQLGRNPAQRIMVATYSQDLARLHASQCRQVMQSEWYRALFPATIVAGDRVLEIVTTHGGGRKAVSVGGTITGYGADIIIIDDCLKADDARSIAKREEAKAWFNGTLATRLNSPGGGTIISISQRLHEDDIAGHLLDKGYDHLCLPAIADRDEDIAIGSGQVYRRTVGDVLDRPGLTREKLEAERRNMGPYEFSAQYQQDPVAPEGNLIRQEWFPTYRDVLLPEHCEKVFQSWDTAYGIEPTSDWSVCTTWGLRQRRFYLLDVFRARMEFPDLKRAVLRLARQWQATRVIIEDAGPGKSLWQELRATEQLRPIMWSVSESKESRLIGVTGQLEAGMCVLPEDAPWLDEFRRELRAFPYGRHDDQVDSMTQFLEYCLRWAEQVMEEIDPRSGRPVRKARPPSPYGADRLKRLAGKPKLRMYNGTNEPRF